MLARGAFKSDELKKKLQQQHFIPVLVDADTEKDVVSKYSVRAFPTVAFTDPKGKEMNQFVGVKAAGAVMSSADAALKDMGPLKLNKSYIKLFKARMKLDKAVARKKTKDAIGAIQAIEAVDHQGLDYEYAQKIKKGYTAEAQKMIAEAKELMADKPSKAKSKLKKVTKTYKGLEVADEAARLLKEIG